MALVENITVKDSTVSVTPQGYLAQRRAHITPEMYGAVGDGVADDTTPVRNALIAAAAAGVAVFGKGGSVYGVVSTISIPAALTEIAYMRLDVIRPTSSGVLSELLSFTGTGSSRITIDIHHNYITCNAKVRQPIILDGTRRCKIHHNTVLGVDTPECYGIRLGISNSGVDNLYNDIYENYIDVGADPDNGAGPVTRNGIVAFGNYADPGASGPDWGGVPSSVQNTRIFNNIVLGGTHNLHLRGCNVIDIFGNTLAGGSHRNINLSTMCQRVHIHDNSLLNAGSAGVVMGNNRWVKINDNYIYSSVSAAVAGDNAGIQGDLWVENLEVQNNTIHGDWEWGIHLLTLRGGNFTDNDIQATWAAIAVESSSVNPVPALAKYTKARSVVYPAITNTYDVFISNNRYAVPSTGCGIYIAGQSGKAVSRITIGANTRTGGTVGDEIYIFNNGLVTNVDVKSHSSAGAVVSNYTDTGVSVQSVGQCTGLDVQTVSVAGNATSFGAKAFSLSAAVAVTNFIGGYSNGDVITVRGFPGGSLVQDSSRIRLRGGVTAVFADSNGVITLQRQAGIWFETARNF